MEKYVLDDEEYYYRNGKWLTSEFTSVPLATVSKLNKMVLDKDNLEEKSMEELLEIIDRARRSDNYQLAAQALEHAARKATVQELRQILPRLCSNYRKVGKPRPAVELCESYLDHYKKQVWSPALFTSLAAAYCDLGDYETGRKNANLARAISGGEASPELISVYKRIKEAEE